MNPLYISNGKMLLNADVWSIGDSLKLAFIGSSFLLKNPLKKI